VVWEDVVHTGTWCCETTNRHTCSAASSSNRRLFDVPKLCVLMLMQGLATLPVTNEISNSLRPGASSSEGDFRHYGCYFVLFPKLKSFLRTEIWERRADERGFSYSTKGNAQMRGVLNGASRATVLCETKSSDIWTVYFVQNSTIRGTFRLSLVS
jgi:hypothetical protein